MKLETHYMMKKKKKSAHYQLNHLLFIMCTHKTFISILIKIIIIAFKYCLSLRKTNWTEQSFQQQQKKKEKNQLNKYLRESKRKF